MPVRFDPSIAGKAPDKLDELNVEEDVRYPAPLVIALLLRDILAEPSKLTPAIVLAVASVAAVEAAIPSPSMSDFV